MNMNSNKIYKLFYSVDNFKHSTQIVPKRVTLL